MRRRILVSSDQPEMPRTIKQAMEETLFQAAFATDLAKTFESIVEDIPDLVIFDVTTFDKPLQDLMWKLNELRITQSVRRVILTERADDEDKVSAFELGADDFLIKPISPRELKVRILAILRSKEMLNRPEAILSFGPICLYRESMEVQIGDGRVQLTPQEFRLLSYFIDNAGRVVRRTELLENLWVSGERTRDGRVVDVYVLRLREKIEPDPGSPSLLVTRRGEGYMLVESPSISPEHKEK